MVITFQFSPPYFQSKMKCVLTQNGLKYILNMFLKSVTKTDLDAPKCKKCYTFFMKASLILRDTKMSL